MPAKKRKPAKRSAVRAAEPAPAPVSNEEWAKTIEKREKVMRPVAPSDFRFESPVDRLESATKNIETLLQELLKEQGRIRSVCELVLHKITEKKSRPAPLPPTTKKRRWWAFGT